MRPRNEKAVLKPESFSMATEVDKNGLEKELSIKAVFGFQVSYATLRRRKHKRVYKHPVYNVKNWTGGG